MIEVVKAGSWTTIQDRGRPGSERYGIPKGGCADWFAAAVANRLVGNAKDAALIECTSAGPALRFSKDVIIAVTGGRCSASPQGSAGPVKAGTTVDVGRIKPGLRTYLAVRGGIDVPPVLGSRSLCHRGRFGGGFGRPLQPGDPLPIGSMVVEDPQPGEWPAARCLRLDGPWEVRVISGPHSDAFPPDALERFLGTAFLITPEIDRMGMRLRSPALRLKTSEILSTPVCEGAVQATPVGEFIVLLSDAPTTGGYPVIATVISADLPLLAQARPGETVHFRAVSQADARRARDRLAAWLSA